MRFNVLAPLALFAAWAVAQQTESMPSISIPRTTEDILSILPITTGSLAFTETGMMSIPQGETPIPSSGATPIFTSPQSSGATPIFTTPQSSGATPIFTSPSNSGAVPSLHTSLTPSGGTPSLVPSGSGTAPPQQSTNAAAPGQFGGDGMSLWFAVTLSALSMTFGFAWTLL